MADRQQLYQRLQKRWEDGTRADLTALVALGAYWGQARRAWAGSSYERQQGWIAKAPLPPPMTASSVEYGEAVFQGDLSRHAAVFHQALGPFYLRVD